MGEPKKVGRAVFINTCRTKACKADLHKLHKAVKANRYQTYIFSPKKPSNPREFVYFDFSYYGAHEKFIRMLRKDHRFDRKKLIIYVARERMAGACAGNRNDARLGKLIGALDKLPHVRGKKIQFSHPDPTAFLFKRQYCPKPTSNPHRRRRKGGDEKRTKTAQEAAKRRKFFLANRRWRLVLGGDIGTFARHNSSWGVGGAQLGIHASITRDIWMRMSSFEAWIAAPAPHLVEGTVTIKHFLGMGLAASLYPVQVHSKRGHYSLNASLGIDLSWLIHRSASTSVPNIFDGCDDWVKRRLRSYGLRPRRMPPAQKIRFSFTPAYMISYTPGDTEGRFDHGPMFKFGLQFSVGTSHGIKNMYAGFSYSAGYLLKRREIMHTLNFSLSYHNDFK